MDADALARAVQGHPEFLKRSQQRSATLETRVTAHILKRLGQAVAGTAMRRFNQDRNDTNSLRLPQLFDVWPQWPIYLTASQVSYVHETLFVDVLSTKLEHTRLLKAFVAATDRVDENWRVEQRPYGMVFEILHTKMGALWLAHTDTRRGQPRCVLHRVTDEIPSLAIEPLNDYLDGIRTVI
jgi:hypothetical protein